IWPLNVQDGLPPDSYGVFYPYLPDLAIAQLMFLAGLAVAALGALGLTAAAGGRWLRGAAAALAAAGLAAGRTPVGLARAPPPGWKPPASSSPRCTPWPAPARSRTSRCAPTPRSRSACSRPTVRTCRP